MLILYEILWNKLLTCAHTPCTHVHTHANIQSLSLSLSLLVKVSVENGKTCAIWHIDDFSDFIGCSSTVPSDVLFYTGSDCW